jgi:alkanesulfonate monooxygenase SsuD/methylene tetrahydromethanopterin reductase-like flavin-dependent oxidoreductase (luciferase family)
MAQSVRFVVAALQEAPWPEMIRRWQWLETIGIDSVILGDHFINFREPKGHWYEAWTLLAALAVHTRTIRIGLLSSVLWRNPAFLARQAMTVDHISGGRLELGLGAGLPGTLDPSYSMTGIPDCSPVERAERFNEVVSIVDQLLRQTESSYGGQYYKFEGTVMNPRPVQEPRPPLMLATNDQSMLRTVAAYADTWITFGGMDMKSLAETLAAVREQNTVVDRYCYEINRDPSTVRRSAFIRTEEEYAKIYSAPGAFEDIIKRYWDMGVKEFILFYPPSPSLVSALERLANEVMPRLREELK